MTTFDHMAYLDAVAASVRESLEIGQRLDIEESRFKHPSSFDPDYSQIGADLAAIAEGMGNLRTIDELSPGDLVKIGDEWCAYEFVVGGVLTVTVEGSCALSEYPLTEGEMFVWQPGHGF